ncbi:MAG: hypothetical protein ACP5U1_07630 [Desulfomonilaceae bacterium]
MKGFPGLKRAYICAFLTALLFCSLITADSIVYASFNITQDAFTISNAPGYCFAIVAFSRWYYLNKPDGLPLRKMLDEKTQARIAKRLQEFYSKNLVKIQADFCNRYNGNNSEPFRRLVSGLTAGEPRLVLLMNRGPSGAVLHAVLAFAWLPEKNLLKVYDPNYTSEPRYIDLSSNGYTSLDITYRAICFPEALEYHDSLIRKIKYLYLAYASPRPVRVGPTSRPKLLKASAPPNALLVSPPSVEAEQAFKSQKRSHR